MGRKILEFHPASLSRLLIYLFGDSAVYSRHRKETEVLDADPFLLSCSVEGLAVKNMDGELEVGESLVERTDWLFTFNL